MIKENEKITEPEGISNNGHLKNKVDEKTLAKVRSFIERFYVDETLCCLENALSIGATFDEGSASFESADAKNVLCAPASPMRPILRAKKSLNSIFDDMDKGFAETLFYYIDKKGITDVEAYKLSNVDKKTFSKIKCNKNYRPSKITAVSFAIGLHLSSAETNHLLSTAGMCLSRSNKFDVIIEYFITSGDYKTIFEVNDVLYEFDQSTLGTLE